MEKPCMQLGQNPSPIIDNFFYCYFLFVEVLKKSLIDELR